ncbi:glycosyl hydrolase family 28 protein [Ruminococcus sp.]|uniref:glycoside hydrolase family 28 protein n=1 Tax=Ruminococcus sp. TaxID=41978 RepID=UPI000E8E7777|nr:glycosyl hydrolase family 28 protein [Ruminococcus sp.]MBS6462819.1 right-handed parallel beta-helix repeat-containing protein [Candidatus Apopatosoma intestinale]MDD6265760.1 glycosyl hydrolase family 28 protein [Clostridia bacterium]MDD6988145.1 glycosyl hydrolase family 28 protein [Ruminococcus sp.]MDY3303814.1 glycosyl hydrolase family 28 protein [Clostridia bacterium]MDY6201740.1 glycosyl hydrolase family 28 protein [Ruminococcus sp.]
MIYDVRNYGAVGDGKTLNTAAIQKAIDDCASKNGGTVLLEDGTYMTGSIVLRSNVNLHIEQNAVLLGSPNCGDYPEKQNLKHVISENLPRTRNASMIFAEECENISITGMGKIDCNGTRFVREKQGEWTGWRFERIDAPTPPRVVFFAGCRNIKIEDITMLNQPSGWSYWIHDCDYVVFDKCKILAEVRYPNNDGIHINSSRNVTVSNCDIVTGDDCIVVRANNRSLAENKVCEKVTVTNCNLTSYSGGIRIGWISDGVIKNCTFSNLVMTDTVIGISIVLPDFSKVPDRGREDTLIENLLFNNIVMDKIYGRPIKIYIGQTDGTRCEAIRNIYFSKVVASGLEFPYLCGRKDNKIRNIYFNDCRFECLSDEELPNFRQHGAADWDRSHGVPIFDNIENIVFNNTNFSK